MSEPVRFALVGCGAAGKIHAQAIGDCSGTELVAVLDVNQQAAQSMADRYNASLVEDLDALCNHASVDAVSIAVPHHCHFDVASRVATAGKHLLLEKPFTLGQQQAMELRTICERARVVVMPWLERRYLPYVDQAREIVQSGMLGKIVYTRVSALGYKPRGYWEYGMRMEEYPSSWRSGRATSGGGVLMMNGVHQIDLMLYITELKVTEVSASIDTLHHEVEVEDMAVVKCIYNNGAMGIIESSCCTYGINQFPIERPADMVMGADGNLQLGDKLKCFDRIRHSREFEFEKFTVTDMKIRQLNNFTQHLLHGEPLKCTADDAIEALAIVEAAYHSSARKSVVELRPGKR